MKILKLVIIGVGLFVSIQTYSQDTIYQKDITSGIPSKIIEVNPTNLRYKKYSNLEGPIYMIEKNRIRKVIYQNGEVEFYSSEDEISKNIERQTSPDLIKGSRLFLKYKSTEDENDVNGNDAENMLKKTIEGLTNCVVVSSLDEADFIITLQVIRKAMANRRAKIEIRHLLSDKVVFKSKWEGGSATVFSGYSGSRAAIDKIVKKRLLKTYPKIKI